MLARIQYAIALVFVAAGISVGGAAFAGVDLAAAVKSGDSADAWVEKTVKENRSEWKSFEEIPDALFNVFYGAPFSEFLKNANPQGGLCGAAALDVAYQAVNQWENLSGSAIGGFTQTLKRWKGRFDKVSGAWGFAKAEGALLDKLKDAAVDTVKDEAKDIGKEAAKDTAKTGDPAIQQKVEDRVKDLYNQIRDYFKKGPVVFWDTRTVGACSIATLWLWDGSKLDLYIYGKCGCSLVKVGSRSIKVSSFALHIEAKTYLDRSDPAKPRIAVSPYDGMHIVEYKSDCNCDGKTAKADPPPPVIVIPAPPPYKPIEETRKTCDACKPLLAKVIEIQKQIETVESEIRDKAGERAAAEAEIRLAKDTGKPEPASAIDKLKELGRDNIRLVNMKIQLTVAWREAIKDLEDCEKKCEGAKPPGRAVHNTAASRRTTETTKRPRKPVTPPRQTISTPPRETVSTPTPPPGVTIDIGIGGGLGRPREHRRGDDVRTRERREEHRGGSGMPGITIGR